MMRTTKTFAFVLLALFALASEAPNAEAQLKEVFSEKASKTLPLDAAGVVFIESYAGSILVTGTTDDKLVVEATRVIKASPGVDVRQIRERLGVVFEGTPAKRTVKSVGLVNSRQLSTRIDYEVKVPAGASVNLIGGIGDAFSVEQVRGRVYVRNVSGRISIDRATGPIFVDSVNADVMVWYRTPPTAGADLKSTNGNVEIRVPESSSVRWLAETLKGDIMTGGLKSLAGELVSAGGQKTYRAYLNGNAGPQLTAVSVTGRLYLLPSENPRSFAASVLPDEKTTPLQEDLGRDYRQVVTSMLIQPPTARSFFIQKGRQEGNLELTAGLGANVFFAQVEGSARVTSFGGEVVIGQVGGACTIESKGGGVNLGEIGGPVAASTAAGDVLVRMARKGGQIETGGGNIHVLYAGDTMTLESGGGDLTVHQAAGGLRARTESGDIVVAADPKPRDFGPITLATRGGNVVFETSPDRGFDIDAEIDADAASARRIESAFPGLTIVREKSGNRVKVRATGKINGGGTSVTIRARDGNIIIGSVPQNRVVMVR
jgi:DUF4097 and DUF4098 domain-containing protein YvlB